MKVFIGGELEHSISDKFRKARNSVIEYMDCLCDISYINELSFYVFCLKGFTTNPSHCIYNRLLLNILQLISQKYGRNF